MLISYSKEQLEEAVKNSYNFEEVCRFLKITCDRSIKKWIKTWKIDKSHFRVKSKYEYIIGNTYGFLKVLTLEKVKSLRNVTRAKCQCLLCNKIFICCINPIIRGVTTSCGCRRDQYNKTTGKNNKGWTGYEEMSGWFLSVIKKSAKLRGLEYNLTNKYLWNLFIKQDRKCALSGLPLKFGNMRKAEITASLDRIDNTKGYINGNVQWIHKHINIMKKDHDQQYFIDLCKKIALTNT